MKDITGQKFGRWVAIKIAEKRPNRGGTRIFWECRCECGNVSSIDASSLKSGHSKSCGCLRREGHKSLPKKVSNMNLLLRNYRNGANKRGLEFSLTSKQFENLVQRDCFYCGVHPQNILKAKWLDGTFTYSGIDRLDNARGYVEGNCVPCCETCNRAKRTMSVEEFKTWIDRVYHHQHPNRVSADISYSIELGNQVLGDGTAKWYQELVGVQK